MTIAPVATHLHQVTILGTCDGCGGHIVTNQQHAPWIRLRGERHHIGCAITRATELDQLDALRDLLKHNRRHRLAPGRP